MLKQHQFNAAVGGMTYTRRPEILKVDISKYIGVEEDSLLLWFGDLFRAITARRIDYDQMKLTFAHTHLAGSAKTWALGLERSRSNTSKLGPNKSLNRPGMSIALDHSP